MDERTQSWMIDSLQELKEGQKNIMLALEGEPLQGKDGLVSRLRAIEATAKETHSDVADLKDWRASIRIKIAFITGAAVTIWEGAKYIAGYFLDNFTNNHKP